MEQMLLNYSLLLLAVGTLALGVLATISLKGKHLTEKKKEFLFFSLISATIVPTLFVIFSTVYLNVVSSSSGPVHWHADFEVWACGTELNLKDPKGLSNKIGTATLHEHNDKRIHLEGLVMQKHDASIGEFFHVIGGELTATSFNLPTNNGPALFNNGALCPSGEEGEVQVFVYKTDKDAYYSQEKVADPASYIIAPESAVPHGDCVIVEFGPAVARTDKLCRSYKVAQEIGKLKGERTNGN